MVDCKVVGSYTSKINFQRGVGIIGPSNAHVTSPPRGAAISFMTLIPVFDSNSLRCSEKSGLPAPIILNTSSTMLLGFLITADDTMLASGEMNSSDPIEAGCASQEATP